jgi:hypothetical protein
MKLEKRMGLLKKFKFESHTSTDQLEEGLSQLVS